MPNGNIQANFDEAKQSQLPFAEMLINMGYRYIPSSEVSELRGGDTSAVILRGLATEKLMEINSYERDGEQVKFTPADIAKALDELESVQLSQDGLVGASKKKYRMLMSKTSGLTLQVSDVHKEKSQDFVFVDFDNIENNDFAFTLEYKVAGQNHRRADIVVFVNGIPFSVIENKKSSIPVSDAIHQLNKYQEMDNVPQLFVYPQLLVATNKEEFLYGTTGTPKKFYTKWREKDVSGVSGYANADDEINEVITQRVDADVYAQILNDLNGATGGHAQVTERVISAQDRGVYFLFKKERLLDLCANYVLYDGLIKKVMRYQQYFGIKKILNQLHQEEQGPRGTRRKGGIVWHTQGSGKSLTMVNLVKEIIEDESIVNPRIIAVTDRVDLDRQLRDVFRDSGLKKEVRQAKSGEDLMGLLQSKDSRIITTLVQKFEAASKKVYAGIEDLDKNVFVLIDEAHRSQSKRQGKGASWNMMKMIPSACYIAFTGTPLLKNGETEKTFQYFIDKYTIDDALDDGVVLPLYYEGRYVGQKQDKEGIDRDFDRATDGASDEQKAQIQKRIEQKYIKDNPKVIEEVAYDIERHFIEHFKGSGLKAQIVVPSQYSAVLMQEYFEESGKLKTAVIISGTDDDKEDKYKVKVRAYLDERAKREGAKYEEIIIDQFKKSPDGVELLIVVDKLLTGFDAPRNTVLYMAKELRDHNLLQAIARINRLFDNENTEFPKTSGFVIDYSENANNLKSAMQLFGSFKNAKDVESALFDMADKTAELEQSYHDVFEMFKGIKNKNDDGEYSALLHGEENEKKRREFYDKVNAFAKNFAEASVFKDFMHTFKDYDMYADDLKKALNLKRSLALQNFEAVDFSLYKNAIIKILKNHVTAEEVKVLTAQINISDFAKEIDKNLKDDKAKAEAMAAKLNKTLQGKQESDPEFYKRFSAKVQEIIDAMHAKKLKDIEALEQLKEIDKQMDSDEDQSLPALIGSHKNADIFYRNLQEVFSPYDYDDDIYVKIIIDIFMLLDGEMIVDWHNNVDAKRRMRSKIDDYLYDELGITDIKESKKVQDICLNLLENNLDIFRK